MPDHVTAGNPCEGGYDGKPALAERVESLAADATTATAATRRLWIEDIFNSRKGSP